MAEMKEPEAPKTASLRAPLLAMEQVFLRLRETEPDAENRRQLTLSAMSARTAAFREP